MRLIKIKLIKWNNWNEIDEIKLEKEIGKVVIILLLFLIHEKRLISDSSYSILNVQSFKKDPNKANWKW